MKLIKNCSYGERVYQCARVLFPFIEIIVDEMSSRSVDEIELLFAGSQRPREDIRRSKQPHITCFQRINSERERQKSVQIGKRKRK